MIRNKQGMSPKLMGILIIGAIALIIYFGLASTGSIITLMDGKTKLPPETGTFTFAGAEGNYETPKLGCSSGSEQIKDTYMQGVQYYLSGLSFCNSLDSGNKLILASSISGYGCVRKTGSSCISTNYIQSKITLPAGKYKVSYNYNLNSKEIHSTDVAFTIDTFSTSFNEGTSNSLVYSSPIETYEFTLKEPKEVIFRIDTGISKAGGSSSGTMNIEFTPSPVIEQTFLEKIFEPNPPTSSSTVQLTFFQKVNLWISNLFSKLFGGNK